MRTTRLHPFGLPIRDAQATWSAARLIVWHLARRPRPAARPRLCERAPSPMTIAASRCEVPLRESTPRGPYARCAPAHGEPASVGVLQARVAHFTGEGDGFEVAGGSPTRRSCSSAPLRYQRLKPLRAASRGAWARLPRTARRFCARSARLRVRLLRAFSTWRTPPRSWRQLRRVPKSARPRSGPCGGLCLSKIFKRFDGLRCCSLAFFAPTSPNQRASIRDQCCLGSAGSPFSSCRGGLVLGDPAFLRASLGFLGADGDAEVPISPSPAPSLRDRQVARRVHREADWTLRAPDHLSKQRWVDALREAVGQPEAPLRLLEELTADVVLDAHLLDLRRLSSDDQLAANLSLTLCEAVGPSAAPRQLLPRYGRRGGEQGGSGAWRWRRRLGTVHGDFELRFRPRGGLPLCVWSRERRGRRVCARRASALELAHRRLGRRIWRRRKRRGKRWLWFFGWWCVFGADRALRRHSPRQARCAAGAGRVASA